MILELILLELITKKMEEIDLKKIECVPHSKSIAIMNNYLLSATQHINKYTGAYSE